MANFEIEMLEDYKGIQKGEKVNCFLEKDKGFYFDYAGEMDTEVGLIPKDKAKKV